MTSEWIVGNPSLTALLKSCPSSEGNPDLATHHWTLPTHRYLWLTSRQVLPEPATRVARAIVGTNSYPQPNTRFSVRLVGCLPDGPFTFLRPAFMPRVCLITTTPTGASLPKVRPPFRRLPLEPGAQLDWWRFRWRKLPVCSCAHARQP